MSESITGIISLQSAENSQFPAMTEIGFVVSPLRAAQLPDTATTEGHWKSFAAAPTVHIMLAQNCMERFAALDLIWGMTVSLPTRWNPREEHPYELQDSALMDKLAENNGQVLGAEITT